MSGDVVFDEEKGWNWACTDSRGNDKIDTFVIIDAKNSVHEDNEVELSLPWTPNSVNSSVQENDSGVVIVLRHRETQVSQGTSGC